MWANAQRHGRPAEHNTVIHDELEKCKKVYASLTLNHEIYNIYSIVVTWLKQNYWCSYSAVTFQAQTGS